MAANLIAETQIAGVWRKTGTQRGTSTLASREWHWQLKVSDTPDSELRRLDVEVRLQPDDEQPLAILAGFLGKQP